jgi:hypothetical protein
MCFHAFLISTPDGAEELHDPAALPPRKNLGAVGLYVVLKTILIPAGNGTSIILILGSMYKSRNVSLYIFLDH